MTISIMQLTPRLIFKHLQRRHRAKRLGIDFHRRESFQLPSRIMVGTKAIDLNLLDEHGTRADFIGIFLDNMYMIESLGGIRSVVDVGANQGLFAIYARILYPDAQVHAYEPNPALENHLIRNCRPLNIKVFMEGIAASGGSCELLPMGDTNQARIAMSPEAGTIPVTSFSAAIERIGGSLDLLKLDCEGFEWEILTDCRSMRRVRHLAMEYHCWANNTDHKDVEPMLKRLGFHVVKQVRSTDFGQVLAQRIGTD